MQMACSLLQRREINEQEIKAIEEAFIFADKLNKGYLTRQELKVAVLYLFGYKPTKYEIDQFMKLTTTGKNGLPMEKFMQIMSTKLSLEDSEQEIRQTFQMFDRHCQGFIEFDDVLCAFKSISININDSVVLNAFRSLDHDRDGRLSYADFKKMMTYELICQ